jgi:hypothetical protein
MLRPGRSKASKQRPCPALGHNITAAECGAQRQSRIACPADCPHNPFGPANYSQLLELEEAFDIKCMDRLFALAPDRSALQRELARATRQHPHALHVFYVWHLFFAGNSEADTFARRWEQTGAPELRNDERVLLRAKLQMRLVLLEIHRVLAGGQVEAVDLLSPTPEPMLIQDRNLAKMASRFSTLLGWVSPLPHFWRMSGTAASIPEVAQFTAPEIVREIAQHLGGPVTEPARRRWLTEHFLRFNETLEATVRLRHQQTLSGMDATWGTAIYELRAAFAQCRERLDSLTDLEPTELNPQERGEGFADAYEWFDPELKLPSKQLTPPGGQLTLGRVLLGQSQCRVETMGTEKLTRLRARLEQQMGGLLRFASERVDDLGARMAAKEPAVKPTLVSPPFVGTTQPIGFQHHPGAGTAARPFPGGDPAGTDARRPPCFSGRSGARAQRPHPPRGHRRSGPAPETHSPDETAGAQPGRA